MQTVRPRLLSFKQRRLRRGSATVEFALVVPVLTAIVIGAPDVSQYLNVGQTVCNASREGARRVASTSVTNVSEVETVVQDYLASAFPSVPSCDLNTALTINVLDSEGDQPPDGDLTAIPSGSAISVEVILPYQTVRWITGFPGLTGKSLRTKTVMRRE